MSKELDEIGLAVRGHTRFIVSVGILIPTTDKAQRQLCTDCARKILWGDGYEKQKIEEVGK